MNPCLVRVKLVFSIIDFLAVYLLEEVGTQTPT